MKTIIAFLFGFALSFWGFLVMATKDNPPRVLAEQTEVTIEPSSTPTQAPSESPTPTPTPTATPSPTPTAISSSTSISATANPTKKPTLSPSSTPSLSPSPSSTPSPSPSPSPTPTQGPTSTPDVWSPPALEPWFAQYAGMYGVDKNVLERIANCESHFNSNAINGPYVGMFQFSPSTWSNYRIQMGSDPSPTLRTNPEESIKTGAFVVSKRGDAPWPACI